jgi:DNA-binding MarR family transcriptional regulator
VAGAPVTRWCEGQFGVTRREWRVIATLAVDGPMLSSQLAEALELDRARTSRALGRLDEMGLVTRTHQVGNARLVQVALAAKGRALFDQLWPVIREHHLRLLAPLSPDETQLLDRLLARITQQAQRLNEDYTDLPKVERRLGRSARPG